MWNLDTNFSLVALMTGIWLVSLFVYLIILAFAIRNTQFMVAHPWRFVIEVILVGIVSSLPIFWVASNRGSSYTRAARDFGLLTMKLGIFYILLELAGINAYLFPPRQ